MKTFYKITPSAIEKLEKMGKLVILARGLNDGELEIQLAPTWNDAYTLFEEWGDMEFCDLDANAIIKHNCYNLEILGILEETYEDND